MNMPELEVYASRDEALMVLAEAIEQGIQNVLLAKPEARILLSGGSTPAPAYRALAARDIDWSSVTIGLVDDRWVPPDHPASNEKLIRENLLAAGASEANFVPMKSPEALPQGSMNEVSAAYEIFMQADVVVLGMGPDGHTASWFPRAKGLDGALSESTTQPVVAIDASGSPVAGDYPLRATVTLPVIKNAKQVILLITGEEKREVWQNAEAGLPIHQAYKVRKNDIRSIWAP
ncbi:MAG: 6-phosphogluconolactonase [Ponticaulis sp.]|nr:6-phosphogluconolactonase [Ponticaulis sp.]|tara:strand:+ start:14181 stop:14879 length:699 start_codon:yes stop_codon:yes gene_type:complete